MSEATGDILLVEDEPDLARVMELALHREGYRVVRADTVEKALQLFRCGDWRAVLLDVMLPDGDGFSFCRIVRAEGFSTPILLVTARGAWQDRVEGLDLGADDYVTKPFVMEELLARVRAALRRAGGLENGEVLRAGDVVLHRKTRQVYRGGQTVTLRRKEFDLLELLLLQYPWVVSRETLIERVWGMDFFGDENILEVCIYQLRRKLEADGGFPIVHTVRGIGYCLREGGSVE